MAESKAPTIDALAVAYLSAQGKNQVEIADALGLSQSSVSRLYKEVKGQFITKTFCEDKVGSAQMKLVLQRVSPKHVLGDKLQELAAKTEGGRAPVVYSVPMPPTDDHARNMEEFALQAAPIVKELLQRVRKTVGVAWGNTIWQTTQVLRTLVHHPWRQKDFPIDFIPLCGDPMLNSLERYADRTSSRVASELSKIVNGEIVRPIWLGLVPAFLPRNRFSKKDMKVLDRFIHLIPQYGRVFGAQKPRSRGGAPLAQDLDMILTAAGSSKHPIGFGRGPLLHLEDREAEVLASHIYGDIGGVFVPKPYRNEKKPAEKPKPHPLVQELTRLWTGLKMEHLMACATRSFAEESGQGGRPGVTLLAFEKDLDIIVLEAVRRGLVNHLIVGSHLEAALLDRLKDMPSPPGSPV